nr:uncharacterized protein LOC123770702 [Procambarus clarkii]
MKLTTFLLVFVCGVQVPRICTAGSQEEAQVGGLNTQGNRCERAGGRCLVGQWAWCSAHLLYNDCPVGTSCCLEASSGEMNKTQEASLGRKVLQLSPRTVENRGIRGKIEDETPRTRKNRNDKRRQHNGGNSRSLRRPNERGRKNEKRPKKKVDEKRLRRKSGDKRSGHRDGKQVKRSGKTYTQRQEGPGEQRRELKTVKKNKTKKYRKMQEKKHRVRIDFNDDDVQLPTKTKKHQDRQRVKPVHKHTLKKKQSNNKACRQGSKCLKKGGTCKKSCSKNENEIPKGCKGGCRCCSSSSSASSSGGCKVKKTCKKLGGACKTSCSSGETDAGKGCKGRNCRCCVAGSGGGKCQLKSSCEALKGSCKALCSATDVLIPDGCQGAACHCCVSKIVGCPSSSECPGRCMASCPGVLSTASCLGSTCSCCLDCKSSSECKDANGVCRAECSCGEKELRDGCSGNGCKCCIPDVPKCSGGSRCSGECVYGPLCTGAVLSNVTCSGQTGCACCTKG